MPNGTAGGGVAGRGCALFGFARGTPMKIIVYRQNFSACIAAQLTRGVPRGARKRTVAV